VLHFAEGAVTAGADGEACARGAVRVPREHIAGTVGAGDAFAAGYLAGHALGFDTEQSLELAVCTAASSLRHITCSEGVRPWRECLEYGRFLGFRATE
jgi:sugar/nucleoside kinase (ribokinase family)